MTFSNATQISRFICFEQCFKRVGMKNILNMNVLSVLQSSTINEMRSGLPQIKLNVSVNTLFIHDFPNAFQS